MPVVLRVRVIKSVSGVFIEVVLFMRRALQQIYHFPGGGYATEDDQDDREIGVRPYSFIQPIPYEVPHQGPANHDEWQSRQESNLSYPFNFPFLERTLPSATLKKTLTLLDHEGSCKPGLWSSID